MASKENTDKMNNEKKSSAMTGFIVVGSVAEVKEAAKTNPLLAKLIQNPPSSTDSGLAKFARDETRTVGAYTDFDREDTRKLLDDWNKALLFEGAKKGAAAVDVSILVIGNPAIAGNDKEMAEAVGGVQAQHEGYDEEIVSGGTEAGGKGGEAKPNGPSVVRSGASVSGSEYKSSLELLLEKGISLMSLDDDENASSDGTFQTHDAATSTAEKLKEAVGADEFPLDPLTREHFGFSKVDSIEQESCLLGLYKGLLLLLSDPPSTKTIQGWQEKNKIAGGVYHYYKSQRGRSWYFKWFMKHQHYVDQTYVNPRGPRAPPEHGTPMDLSFWPHYNKGGQPGKRFRHAGSICYALHAA